jgi:HEAT repeat protein
MDNAAFRQATERLGQIGEGNSDAISALIYLLHANRDELTHWSAIKSVNKIGSGNSEFIQMWIPEKMARISEWL